MVERVVLIVKKPEVNKDNSDYRMRRTNHSRSVNTSVDRILFLQRTVGNQAVQRLLRSGILQAKLRIGQPGDAYEQEADRVADAVMRMSEPQTVSSDTLSIQGTCPTCEKDELRRQLIEKEEAEELLQTKEISGQNAETTPDLESRINAIRGAGQPLAESERAFFEPRFGRDFSQVRVHTDAQAAETARAVNAQAFTVGQDVVFGAGQYARAIEIGRQLLAHELTHVVQQSNGIKYIQRDVILHNAGCPLETLDHTRNSNQIGALFGTPIAYGITHFRTRTPGRQTVLGRMITPNQGEIWISNATIFPVTEILMYLTNQFANGSCEYNWTFSHEITHWLGGCDKFERKLSLLQSDLQSLPGLNNRQRVNGNQLVVEQARRNLETRVDTILRCFRIDVCREISRFNRRLDLQTYPQAFSSCRQPPQVPQVPPIAVYLRTCNPPPLGCPRPIP
jgi:hypothetical protein